MYNNLSPEELQRIEIKERLENYDRLTRWKKRAEACLESIDAQREDIEELIKRGYDVHDHELSHAKAVLNDIICDYVLEVQSIHHIEEELGLPITPYESIPYVDAREVPEGYKVKEWDHPHVLL